jgi:hypothetical protein
MAANAPVDDRPGGPSLSRTSDGGLSGSHGDSTATGVPVATATGAEQNTIVRPLRPVACWSVGDVRFAFDSSFIDASAAEEFVLLKKAREDYKELVQKHEVYPPLSIFGHADPVGQDDYNKQLAGRRARAVYAALVRDTAAWEQLYSQPLPGDSWGMRSIQTMLVKLGLYNGDTTGSLDADTQTAVRAFQRSQGLVVDGDPGPQTRARLFQQYMDKLCGADLVLSKTDDFLARGADKGSKGDYQGCGEFNPVLMFSSAENDRLSQPSQKGERDAQNAPNRRVLAFLFAPGEVVDPAKWPCPRASEGSAGCRRRFWSDASVRRSFQAQRRQYETTRDTFACRFYDLLADRSPCERAVAVLRVRLHDAMGYKLPAAPYQIEYSGRTKSGKADQDGFVSEVLEPGTESCTVRWQPPDDSDPADSNKEFLYELVVFIELQNADTEEGLKRRLHNLGYPYLGDPDANIRAFQAHHGVDITGEVDDATKAKLQSIYSDALDEPMPLEDVTPPANAASEQRT